MNSQQLSPRKWNYFEIPASLIVLHNETCKVYTHLVEALILPLIATAVIQVPSEPQYLNVSGADYAMFESFFCSECFCSECCLIHRATYYIVGSHSRSVEQFWHRTDLHRAGQRLIISEIYLQPTAFSMEAY